MFGLPWEAHSRFVPEVGVVTRYEDRPAESFPWPGFFIFLFLVQGHRPNSHRGRPSGPEPVTIPIAQKNQTMRNGKSHALGHQAQCWWVYQETVAYGQQYSNSHKKPNNFLQSFPGNKSVFVVMSYPNGPSSCKTHNGKCCLRD